MPLDYPDEDPLKTFNKLYEATKRNLEVIKKKQPAGEQASRAIVALSQNFYSTLLYLEKILSGSDGADGRKNVFSEARESIYRERKPHKSLVEDFMWPAIKVLIDCAIKGRESIADQEYAKVAAGFFHLSAIWLSYVVNPRYSTKKHVKLHSTYQADWHKLPEQLGALRATIDDSLTPALAFSQGGVAYIGADVPVDPRVFGGFQPPPWLQAKRKARSSDFTWDFLQIRAYQESGGSGRLSPCRSVGDGLDEEVLGEGGQEEEGQEEEDVIERDSYHYEEWVSKTAMLDAKYYDGARKIIDGAAQRLQKDPHNVASASQDEKDFNNLLDAARSLQHRICSCGDEEFDLLGDALHEEEYPHDRDRRYEKLFTLQATLLDIYCRLYTSYYSSDKSKQKKGLLDLKLRSKGYRLMGRRLLHVLVHPRLEGRYNKLARCYWSVSFAHALYLASFELTGTKSEDNTSRTEGWCSELDKFLRFLAQHPFIKEKAQFRYSSVGADGTKTSVPFDFERAFSETKDGSFRQEIMRLEGVKGTSKCSAMILFQLSREYMGRSRPKSHYFSAPYEDKTFWLDELEDEK
ncbi:hypothetical protein BJ508DRAFT_19675 [Ascobolus immersus RN42]|uniref:Uncharacterized protein n=1 Tax=Ascobolus immersus RN42 TaxID=1160509 RepID=A0A3N4IGY3_ASCIM|nr:hypothetical protein BJ508DRAFT_19675 [Ascobolus immersus RN42]